MFYNRKKKVDLSVLIQSILTVVLLAIIFCMAYRIYVADKYLEKIENFYEREFTMYQSHFDRLTYPIYKETKIACNKHDVSLPEVLSFFNNESHFNPRAVSHCGAMGIGQLMPDTAKKYGVKNPFDIKENIDASVQFYKLCRKRADGDVMLAYMKYNGGPARRHFPVGGESDLYGKKCVADLTKCRGIFLAAL